MNLKKPKFWEYNKPNIYAYLLYPFTLLIKFLNILKSKTKNKDRKIKTICVGNIYVGGTGKTSLCIKIKKILDREKIKSCFIKKYYKNQIDEQKILKEYGKVFISHKREDAIQQAENENFEVAILDDGLQDKSIDCNLSFVCFNNINWIGNGMTIPSGPLRESITNMKKYNHVFLNGNQENEDILINELLKINSNLIIHIGQYKPINLNNFKKNQKYLVFSGIGNHKTFVSMIKKYGLEILRDIEFADHYTYTKKDIDLILSEAEDLKCEVVTTEKDFLRLENFDTNKIKYIKSELQITDENKLIKYII
tara:strand:- start:339 stop:1265 length:927 start_codon:yes stop_codon:yes gene_type:complete